MDWGHSHNHKSHGSQLIPIGVIQRGQRRALKVHRIKKINNDNPSNCISHIRSQRITDLLTIRQRQNKIHEDEKEQGWCVPLFWIFGLFWKVDQELRYHRAMDWFGHLLHENCPPRNDHSLTSGLFPRYLYPEKALTTTL